MLDAIVALFKALRQIEGEEFSREFLIECVDQAYVSMEVHTTKPEQH